jgi:hypothetical protein
MDKGVRHKSEQIPKKPAATKTQEELKAYRDY